MWGPYKGVHGGGGDFFIFIYFQHEKKKSRITMRLFMYDLYVTSSWENNY